MDVHGFSALPGGYRFADGYFHRAGDAGIWWSASEYEDYAYSQNMSYDNGKAISYYSVKSGGLSVRCIKD
jgi:uncharacterized protein (TIGR02145 family)